MPQLFSTTRDEAAALRFPLLFYPLTAAAALALQAYLPVLFHAAVYLDLPLLVVIYYALNRRRQIYAAGLGALLGLLQDSIAHLALGLNGVAKTVIGYGNASFGVRLDADHVGIRFVIVAGCCELNRAILYCLSRFLLGTPIPWQAALTALAALANGIVAVLLFSLLDRFRHWI